MSRLAPIVSFLLVIAFTVYLGASSGCTQKVEPPAKTEKAIEMGDKDKDKKGRLQGAPD